MQTEELVERWNAIRAQGKSVYTNLYRNIASFPAQEWDATASELTLCLFLFEGGARRVQFVTSDSDDLARMLAAVKEPAAIDMVGRNPSALAGALAKGGFHPIAQMHRWANRDISAALGGNGIINKTYGNINSGGVAREDDARQILDIYRKTFDTRISHLPSLGELKENIDHGEVVIHREAGRIRTILQRTIEPKRFYIHQVYNDGEKAWLHGIILSELRRYYAQGGRYLYAWIQDTNIASQKMHAKYGMAPDGLWDVVYANCP